MSSKRHHLIQRPRILVLEALSGSTSAVRAAGGDPITINPRDLKAVYDALNENVADGVLLTGGGDVDPGRYGQQPHRHVYGVSEDRDLAEFTVLAYADSLDLPVMGICRGAQVMNVAAGGTLHQHLPDVKRGGGRHRCGDLPTRFEQGSLIAEALGTLTATTVHLHHQAVRKVGRGYRVTARHADGTVEAIESTTGTWRIGAQFHPEMARRGAPERGLFRQLVVHSALRAGLDVPPVIAPPAPKRKPRPVAAEPAFSGRQSPVTTWYRCFRCGNIDFDLREDYVDHMEQLHHVTLSFTR